METLNGISKKWFELDSLQKVSDLIYYEGPLLSHYSSVSGDNYFFYWVDVDDTYNRWLIFRVTTNQLNDYLNKKISLLNVIQKSPDGFVYSVDIDDDLNYNNIQMLSQNDLPSSYLPKSDSLYEFQIKSNDSVLHELSSKSSAGLLQASFKNSSKVGYGTINLEVLSPTLQNINEMSLCLGQSYFKLKQNNVQPDSKNKKQKLNKKEILLSTQFNVVGCFAGSFKLILQPIDTQTSIEGTNTNVDEYCTFLLGFLQSSFEYENLLKYIDLVDANVITNYEKLLKNIQAYKLELDLKWINKSSGIILENKIDYKSVPQIIDNITRLEYQNPSKFNIIGRFLEVNLKTKHYTFLSNTEDELESKGYFDKLLIPNALLIKFNQDYEVTIERLESKETGSKNPKIEDKLTAFFEV